jgi:hypothetical protein
MSKTPKSAVEASNIPSCETAVELSEGSNDVCVDPDLVRSTILKFDKFMMPQMALLVLLAYLDRSNIGTFICRDVIIEKSL